MSISRTNSERFLVEKTDVDLFMNKNVEWMNFPFLNIIYIIAILVCWGLLVSTRLLSTAECWTATNVIHGVVTFVLLHWIKGCPDESTQGVYNDQTLYEQIDAGVPYTQKKKFLMLIPAILTWVSCHVSDYQPIYLIVNVGLFAILIIAKIPEMHKVRLFGINATLGIDTKVEYSPSKGD